MPTPSRNQHAVSRPGRLLAPALLALALQIALSAGPGLAGGDKNPADPQIAEQKKAALANWKRAYEKDEIPAHLETANLLLYGKVPGKTLEEIGQTLEKDVALAKKTLAFEKLDSWPGKLTVYLLPERADFPPFIRRVERRRPEPEEAGSFAIRSDTPHVVAGPPRGPGDPPVDQQAGEQLAAALLTKKAGASMPFWVVAGFGRATVTQALPQRDRFIEHQRALQLATQKKRTAQDAWAGGIDEAEAAVLRGSVVEYLAYSGRTKRFGPLLSALRPNENGQTPSTAEALKAAEIVPGRLNQLWQTWLRTGK